METKYNIGQIVSISHKDIEEDTSVKFVERLSKRSLFNFWKPVKTLYFWEVDGLFDDFDSPTDKEGNKFPPNYYHEEYFVKNRIMYHKARILFHFSDGDYMNRYFDTNEEKDKYLEDLYKKIKESNNTFIKL